MVQQIASRRHHRDETRDVRGLIIAVPLLLVAGHLWEVDQARREIGGLG